MIPLRDNIPSRTRPNVNYAVIALCALVFLIQLSSPNLVERLGMIPARVLDPERPIAVVDVQPVLTDRGVRLREVRRPAAPAAVPAWLTVVTCIFLHGGWLHFLGNMWFLWIFGDNVEDRLGHVGYLLFYLGSGVAASGAHLLAGPDSTVPTIGASGAIAGVMGAYFLLYPRAKVLTLVPVFFFLHIVILPAPLFLGVWFALQLLQGTFAVTGAQAGGVAWWAHVGGFVAGLAVGGALRVRDHLRPPAEWERPEPEHVTHYRIRSRRREF